MFLSDALNEIRYVFICKYSNQKIKLENTEKTTTLLIEFDFLYLYCMILIPNCLLHGLVDFL